MPRNNELKKILLIGSGPIVIGQGCEFDYSGVQACKALREENYQVVLVNSNPATIMTDPEFADRTYLEPVTPDYVELVIAKERPDAILPTMGGQTALNVANLAVGYRLDETPNDITKTTPASFEPVLDYVVVKCPRFAFEKFAGADPRLTTQMKSVGESMAIGRTFKEALQKGLRALEIGRPGWTTASLADDRLVDDSLETFRGGLRQPSPERVFQI